MLPRILPLVAMLLASALAQGSDTTRSELEGNLVDTTYGELTSLAFDSDETLWIGSSAGVFVYRHGQFFVHNAYNTPIPDEGISTVSVDKQNVKWFGSRRGYVYSFDGKRWQVFSASKGLRDWVGPVRCIRSNGKGGIWLTADYGLTGLLQIDNDKIEAFNPNVKSAADERKGIESPRIENSRVSGRVPSIDVDPHGHLWVACHLGLLRFDGQEWTRQGGSQFQKMEIANLCCDAAPDTIYYVAVDIDRREDPFGLPNAMACVFANGRSKIVTNRMQKSGLAAFRVEQEGRFAGYIMPRGTVIGNREKVQRCLAGTPLKHEIPDDFAVDKQGRAWFVTRFAGMCRHDLGKWTTFGPQDRRKRLDHPFPLPAWQKRPMLDLIREEPVDADIHAVVKNPRKYADKKIRIVGSIASGFEYAEMTDAHGERLGMWPENKMLNDGFERAAIPVAGKESKPLLYEYLGYLQWGGYFGHTGGWPMQFTIVEKYPADMDKGERAEAKKRYLARFEEESYDWPISEYLPESAELRRLRERLQGAWVLNDVQEERTWQRLRGDPGTRWIVSGDRLTTGSPGYWSRGIVRFDTSHMPATVDYESSETDQFAIGPKSLKGILSLDGDMLQVCLSEGWNREHPRPRQFKPDDRVCTVVYTLQRDRNWMPPAAGSSQQDDPACIDALQKADTRIEHDDRGNVVAAEFAFIQVHGYHPPTDAVFASLRGLHHLERIDTNGADLSDEGLKSVAHCRDLVGLGVGGNHITDMGLESIGGLTRLERLELRDTQVTDAGIEKLKNLTNLKLFSLSSNSFTGSGLGSLSGSSTLLNLQLGGEHLDDEVFRHLASFPSLKFLRFFSAKLNGSHAENLAACENLESLWVDDTQFGDAGMKSVSKLYKLKSFRAAKTPITDAGIASLGGLSTLEEIFVYDTAITDAGLKSLEALPNLRRLWLNGTAVTTEGIARLKKLPRLENLYLYGTRIDNEGLKCLKSFPKLRTVGVSGPLVTEEATKALRKELPTLRVDFRKSYLH